MGMVTIELDSTQQELIATMERVGDLQRLKYVLERLAKKKEVSVDYLPQENISSLCGSFSVEIIRLLILEQLPFPSKDPQNDLVYKLRCYLASLEYEAY
jgi:hypothetical protein